MIINASAITSESQDRVEKVFNNVVKCGKMWGFYNIFTPINND